MIAVKCFNSVLLPFFIAILPSAHPTIQSMAVNGQRIAPHEGGKLLTAAEVEAVVGGSWRLIDCYYDLCAMNVAKDRCTLFLTTEIDSRTGIQARAFSARSRSSINADVKNVFIGSVAGKAKIVKGIGDEAYYGTFIHKQGNSIRRQLWVIEGDGHRFVIIEMYSQGVTTNAADDAVALDKLKALAIKVLQRV